ncbi:MAG: hypothetical protein GY937_10335 [bacterium]|nr:hypothetical protein [bacterium]
MRRLILLALLLLAVAAALPWLPGPTLAQRLPRASLLYSRPWVLVPGARVDPKDLETHLERTHYRAVSDASNPAVGTYHRTQVRWTIGLRPFDYPDGSEPGGAHVLKMKGTRIESITGPDGEMRDSLFLEPLRLAVLGGPDAAPRELLALEDLPQHLIDAVLVAEDRRFFVHPGVDPVRVAGAALENAKERRIVEGGSTLTQQLVKNVWLSPARTWARKFREVGIAVWLEFRYSKREILEAYLNEIYLGQAGGRAIHGVGPAARFWYAKDATEISLAESALLAGMVRAPSALAPDRHPDRARARRDQVLDAMLAHGRIGESVHHEARQTPVVVHRRRSSRASAPGFTARVRHELARETDVDELGEAGLRIFSTLDPHFQHEAKAAVSVGLARLEKGYPLLKRKKSPLQAALVAMDPHSGDVLGWVGGRRQVPGGFDRVSGARRQPGSVFKPIVALAAFTLNERGAPGFTLGTVLEDAPLQLGVEGEAWEPSNHSGRLPRRGPSAHRARRFAERAFRPPWHGSGARACGGYRTPGRNREPPSSDPEPVPRRLRSHATRDHRGLRRARGSREGACAPSTTGRRGGRARPRGAAILGKGRLRSETRSSGDRGIVGFGPTRDRQDPGPPGRAWARRRQDRHQQRFSRRLVRGLHTGNRGRRLGRLRRRRAGRLDGGSGRTPDRCTFPARGARRRRGLGLRGAARAGADLDRSGNRPAFRRTLPRARRVVRGGHRTASYLPSAKTQPARLVRAGLPGAPLIAQLAGSSSVA